MSDAESFRSDLLALGFRPVQDRGTGTIRLSMRATSFLTYWVHWSEREGTVLFTWEHALAEMMSALGLQLGANEDLNQFLFPKHDARGPQEIAFVVQEMDRTEQMLRSIDLLGD
ncbi:MAG TPA: hypothetical protein VGB83_05580 [Actinomycetota bacterium]